MKTSHENHLEGEQPQELGTYITMVMNDFLHGMILQVGSVVHGEKAPKDW